MLRISGLILLNETFIQCGSPRRPFKTRQRGTESTYMHNNVDILEKLKDFWGDSAMHLYVSMQWRLHASGYRQYGTFPFLSIGQSRRYDQLPLLSRAHALQAFVPAFDHFLDAQREPHCPTVPRLISTGGQTQPRKVESGGLQDWRRKDCEQGNKGGNWRSVTSNWTKL